MHDDNLSTNPPGDFGVNGRNQYYPWRQCQEDDTFTFSSDGNLRIDFGGTSCDNYGDWFFTTPQPYEYDRENAALKIGSSLTLHVAEINESRLKLYVQIPGGYIVYLFQRK